MSKGGGPPTTASDIRDATREAREVLADIRAERRAFIADREHLIAEIVERLNTHYVKVAIDRINYARGQFEADIDQKSGMLLDAAFVIERQQRQWLDTHSDKFLDRVAKHLAREIAKGGEDAVLPPGRILTGRATIAEYDGQKALAVEVRKQGQQPRAAGPAQGNGQAVPPAFKRPDA